MKLNEEKLPKWAQERLSGLRLTIKELEDKNRRLQEAHAVLFEREWFVINGPAEDTLLDVRHLWLLYPDRPHCICALHRNDVLLVGRYIPKEGGQ